MSAPAPNDPFTAFCAKLKDLHESAAVLDERQRSEMLTELVHARGHYGNLPQWNDAANHLRQLCGLDITRMTGLLSLDSTRDMRLALRWEPTEPRPRTGSERVLPTSGWLSDYLDLHSHMESQYALHFWSAVAVVAATCRRNYYLEWNAYSIYPHHYIMIVGETGSGKSVAISKANEMARRVNSQLGAHERVHAHTITGSPEGFCDQLAVRIKGESTGRTESTGMVINDDVTSIFGKAQFGGDRWVTLLTYIYTQDNYDEPLRSRGVYEYRNLAVTGLFGSTIEWLRKECTPSSFEGGWLGRCVYVERPPDPALMYPRPPVIDPVQLQRMACELAELSVSAETEMALTDDAKLFYDAWYRDYRSKRVGEWLMTGWNNRKRVHVLKLAMVLALCERPRSTLVKPCHLEQAAAIIGVEEERLAGMFGNLTASGEAEKLGRIVYVLQNAQDGRMLWSEMLKRAQRYMRNVNELRTVIEAGIELERVHLETARYGKGIEVVLGPRPPEIPIIDPPAPPRPMTWRQRGR